MMSGRADPFTDAKPEEKLDLKHFRPLRRAERVDPEEVRRVAEKAAFQSREPATVPSTPETKTPRLYRTGRTFQFQCKVTQALHEEIYRLTNELARRMEPQMPGMRWTLGMTVERMVAALNRELE